MYDSKTGRRSGKHRLIADLKTGSQCSNRQGWRLAASGDGGQIKTNNIVTLAANHDVAWVRIHDTSIRVWDIGRALHFGFNGLHHLYLSKLSIH